MDPRRPCDHRLLAVTATRPQRPPLSTLRFRLADAQPLVRFPAAISRVHRRALDFLDRYLQISSLRRQPSTAPTSSQTSSSPSLNPPLSPVELDRLLARRLWNMHLPDDAHTVFAELLTQLISVTTSLFAKLYILNLPPVQHVLSTYPALQILCLVQLHPIRLLQRPFLAAFRPLHWLLAPFSAMAVPLALHLTVQRGLATVLRWRFPKLMGVEDGEDNDANDNGNDSDNATSPQNDTDRERLKKRNKDREDTRARIRQQEKEEKNNKLASSSNTAPSTTSTPPVQHAIDHETNRIEQQQKQQSVTELIHAWGGTALNSPQATTNTPSKSTHISALTSTSTSTLASTPESRRDSLLQGKNIARDGEAVSGAQDAMSKSPHVTVSGPLSLPALVPAGEDTQHQPAVPRNTVTAVTSASLLHAETKGIGDKDSDSAGAHSMKRVDVDVQMRNDDSSKDTPKTRRQEEGEEEKSNNKLVGATHSEDYEVDDEDAQAEIKKRERIITLNGGAKGLAVMLNEKEVQARSLVLSEKDRDDLRILHTGRVSRG